MKVRALALYRIPQGITAARAGAFRIAVQIYYAFSGERDTVARGAHLAGFAAGAGSFSYCAARARRCSTGL